jgi:hypothetical protein
MTRTTDQEKLDLAVRTLEEVWYALSEMYPTDAMDDFDAIFEKVRTTAIELGGLQTADEEGAWKA